MLGKNKTKNAETKMECLELASKLIKDIEEGSIEDQLIRYISKFFHIGRAYNGKLLEYKEEELFDIKKGKNIKINKELSEESDEEYDY